MFYFSGYKSEIKQERKHSLVEHNNKNIGGNKMVKRKGNLKPSWYWSGCAETDEMCPSPFTAKTTRCKLPPNSK